MKGQCYNIGFMLQSFVIEVFNGVLCCPLFFEFFVGIGMFWNRNESDLLLFLFVLLVVRGLYVCVQFNSDD